MELKAHKATAQLAALIVLQLLVQIGPVPLATQMPQVTLVVRVQTSTMLEVVPGHSSEML